MCVSFAVVGANRLTRMQLINTTSDVMCSTVCDITVFHRTTTRYGRSLPLDMRVELETNS